MRPTPAPPRLRPLGAAAVAALLVFAAGARGQCPPPRPETGPVQLSFTPAVIANGDVEFLYHAPPGSTRIILLFHGAGGSAASWFDKVERVRFVQAAVDRGWAVGALDSSDRDTGQWSTLPAGSNPDIANVEARLADLVALGLLAPDARVVIGGHSNGGAFTSRLSQALGVRAMMISGAKGIDAVFALGAPPPTFFVTGRNDMVSSPAEVAGNAAVMAARGLPYFFVVNEPAPVTAEALERIPGVDPALAASVHAAFLGAGLLDACGLQVTSPRASGWEAVLPAAAAPFESDIEEQLLELYGDHQTTSDFTEDILDFFDFPGCGEIPSNACRRSTKPAKARLVVKDDANAMRRTLTWKWPRGAATALGDFGDPLAATDYGICIYDAVAGLVVRAAAPAGGQCGSKSCWRATPAKYRYADRERTPDGIRTLVLKSGEDGSTVVKVKAKGERLALPALPLGLPVVVQVAADDGRCWQAHYADPGEVKQNDAARFRANASSPSGAFP